jgi:hypothetical protein
MGSDWKYFKAQIDGNTIKTAGQAFCLLGHSYHLDGYPKPGGTWSKWEFKDNTLTIENDCLGFYPIYYCLDETKIIVSNSILKIIAEAGDVELDENALSMFARKNYFLNNCTAYKNIKTLAPNTTIKWSAGSFTVNQSFLPASKPANLSHEQIVDGYVELTRQAMSRNLPSDEKFLMPLSGGRDSRIILLELLNRGFRPEICVTCGESRDVKLATQVCQRLGLENKILEPRQRWIGDAVRKNIRISFATIQHDWLMGIGDFVRNSGLLSYDGNGVGMFSRNAYTDNGMRQFEMLRGGKYDEFEDEIFPSDNAAEKYINMLPEQFGFIKGGLDGLKKEHFENISLYNIYSNHLSAFSFYSNTRTAISTCPFGIMYPAKIYCPLLDYDLFSFVASLTPEQMTAKEPQADAVRKAYTDLADVPFYNELKFEPAPKIGRLTKLMNVADATKFLAKFDSASLPSFYKTKFSKAIDKDDLAHARFLNLLFYLAMVKYCSKRNNAIAMLEWLEDKESINEKSY